MKRIISIRYSSAAFNFSMLLIRVVFGVMMIAIHGYDKLANFSSRQNEFYSFFGLGSKLSLILAIFAEVLCSLFLVLGLFTRLAAIPLIITMLVAIFGFNAGKPMVQSEVAFLYLSAFTTLLFCGPGKISVDGMINK